MSSADPTSDTNRTPFVTISRGRWLLVAALPLFGLIAALAASAGDLYVSVCVGAIMLAFAVLRPREGALVALILGLLQYGPTKALTVLPASLTIVDDLLLLGVGARLFFDAGWRQYRPPVWILAWVGLWAAAGCVSAVVNGVGLMTAMLAYRWLFLPVVLCVALARWGRSGRYASWVVGILIAYTALQAIVVVLQALASGRIGDTNFGLLGPGGHNLLGYGLLIGTSLLAAGEGRALLRLGGVTLGLLGILACGSRGALLAAPLALLASQIGLLRRPRRIAVILVLAVAGVVATGAALATVNLTLGEGLSPSSLLASQYDPLKGGRLLYARGLRTVLDDDPLSWALGLGPSQYTSEAGRADPSPEVLRIRVRIGASERFASIGIEWVTVMGEYGVVGVVCLMGLLVRPLVLRRRLGPLLAEGGTDALSMAVRAAPSLVVIAAVGFLGTNLLEYQPVAYMWWAVLGLVEAAAMDPGSSSPVL